MKNGHFSVGRIACISSLSSIEVVSKQLFQPTCPVTWAITRIIGLVIRYERKEGRRKGKKRFLNARDDRIVVCKSWHGSKKVTITFSTSFRVRWKRGLIVEGVKKESGWLSLSLSSFLCRRVIFRGQVQYGRVFPIPIYSFIPAVEGKKR